MTNNKYYWLKLKIDFFEEDTIAFIEEQDNGILYSNFYLKLCLKSLKNNGKLVRQVGETLIPYDIKSLSKLTGVDIDIINQAMDLFKNIGLVKILENGEIYLTQVENMIGSESTTAERVRNHRKNQQMLHCNTDVTQVKQPCNADVTQTKQKCNIDIEIDKEIEIEKDIKEKNTKRKLFVIPTKEEIVEYCKERQNEVDAQKFYDFYQSKGWYVGKNKMKDWKACVRTWEKNQPNTRQDIISVYDSSNNQLVTDEDIKKYLGG